MYKALNVRNFGAFSLWVGLLFDNDLWDMSQ